MSMKILKSTFQLGKECKLQRMLSHRCKSLVDTAKDKTVLRRDMGCSNLLSKRLKRYLTLSIITYTPTWMYWRTQARAKHCTVLSWWTNTTVRKSNTGCNIA